MELVKKIKIEWVLIALLLFLGMATRFYHFGQPNQIVFDEIYFSKFATDYFKGEYYFDIHPPLAKLMMAGWAKISGAEIPISFDFKNIGKEYTDNFYKYLRFLVSLFGALFPLIIYFFTKELFQNKIAGFLAGLFVVFDNALLTQSRLVLMDIFLLFFGFLGLWFLLLSRKKVIYSKSWLWFIIFSGLFLTASFAVKWTGLIFIGVAGFILLFDCIKNKQGKVFVNQALILFFVGFIVYYLIFAAHLNLLFYSGSGDAFMTPSFQKTLIGNKYYEDTSIKPAGTFLKFLELNKTMYTANASIKATHSYGSQWYTWPFLLRPIYYWFGAGEENLSARIYLQGNPFVWWLGLVVFVYWLLWLVRQFFKKVKDSDFFPILLLVVGYIGNMLAYVFVDRVAFLYHYFPSLLFLIVGLAVFFAKYFSKSKAIIIGLVLIVILFFQFFAPLSYGLPMTDASFQERVWFKSWQ